MMKTTSLLIATALLTILTGCDGFDGREFQKERAARLYRTAMEDYRAGRLTQAIEALKKVCHEDPANTSARFQLACLLQDSAKDYFGAACAYREYLAQRGESEKGALAKDRLADCERELAKVLASKYKLNDIAEQESRNAVLQDELKLAGARQAKLQKDLAAAMQRIAHLTQEADRLKALMKKDDSAGESRATDVSEALGLLQDEESETKTRQTDVSDAETVKSLLNDEANGSEPLTQPVDAKAKRDAAKRTAEAAEAKRAADAAAEKAKRPDTYVVCEGDTLYKLAVRFYGQSSAWSKIREANKAIISTDGRIKAGQKLVLPE